ncbi:amidohydrolase [Streptomyces sp. Ru73]|uniref:M20 family metallopeptidase n=1 Tax=Streptomyces sp. Ru73 TaxID=2080748 RepID=UPI000CDDA7F5|nr:M20 family metallopeptidase [Streptomyces sp. Ru73]POX38204.1 amidohydrolase [Streptomyces sp. Ru73]
MKLTAHHRTARAAAESWREELLALSHRLHAEPELSYEERRSAAALTEAAERAGFTVERGVAGLPTAFTGVRGSGDLVIGVCAEYDALPGMGHACGHNVNGTAALGAALALGAVADDLGITVKLLGTPAEEDGGGKVDMIEHGLFDEVAVAMMVHANDADTVGNGSLAIGSWDIAYTGRPAHASAAPWEGRNALDALTVAQTALGLLRQQLPPESVVHGIITDGGQAANVIPARTAARYEVRSPTMESLRTLQDRVRACFEAGALATGTELRLEPHGHDFADLRQDPTVAELYAGAAEALGRTVGRAPQRTGSTDMGNVSHLLPTIHPMIGYDTGGARHHTPEFAAAGVSEGADKAVLDGAVAMAWTGVALAADAGHRERLLAAVARRAAARKRAAEDRTGPRP